MTNPKVEIDPAVFNDVYIPFLDNYSRTQIYFGGSSSGKSKFVIGQRTVYRLLKGGHNFLICRQTKNSIRGSVATEIQRVIDEWDLSKLLHVNKTDGTITCINGYQAVFAGLDDVEKLKSIAFKKGALTDVIVEEATETDKKSIKQLMKRQRGQVDEGIKKTITLLFNPILQSHWIYEDYFKSIAWADDQKEYVSDRLTILKTTYKDNKFLEQEDIDDLENETDKYYRDVYTLGKWGVLGHVIFTNWRVEDLSGMVDQFTNHRNGLDFGFSSDPAALWVAHYDRAHKRIYVYDELYERGLTNDLLADEIKQRVGSAYVVCDSAEPKSIAELQQHGVKAQAASKGKDSVLHGIQWLQQCEIIIDKKCVNTKAEISTYHWKEDANGNAIPKPSEKNNHLIDAGRYAHETDMRERDARKMVDFA